MLAERAVGEVHAFLVEKYKMEKIRLFPLKITF